VRALKGGALDFIEKPFSDQLRSTASSRRSPPTANPRAERHACRHSPPGSRQSHHAARAARYALVRGGRRTREIAAELGLSVKTVEVHRARVMEKMRWIRWRSCEARSSA